MSNLKEMWDQFKEGGWSGGEEQYKKFIEAFPQEDLATMPLSKYTSLKEKDKEGEYFTYWLERGTESCGKFRTSSSYAYGIYKVNPENKPKGIDETKWKKAMDGYRTSMHKKNKIPKDEFVFGEAAESYFKKEVRPKLISLAAFKEKADSKPLDINYCRKIAYLYNPGKLIPIYKKEVIEAIAKYFWILDQVKDSINPYRVTENILVKIAKQFDLKIDPENKSEAFEITQNLGAFLWEKFGQSFALESKNIILHGAPGTGKTYGIDHAVRQKLRIEVGEENIHKYYKLVQFHPSFGYEEFIDGIKPDGMEDNGQMRFKLVNGIFKKMCIKAASELKNPTGKDGKPKNFYFVADEINRAEISRVFGEVLLCLEEDKRLTYKDEKWSGTNIHTLNTALWEEGDAVITVEGEKYFGVPENLYFIGTMNDIDRSVDSFDMALRRRFLWKHYQCDYNVIAMHSEYKDIDDEELKKYIAVCENLNNYIVGKSGFDLGESYQLGHSYFLKPKKINKTQLAETWENHIKPLLREYLRSSVPLGKIEEKLKEAQKIFQLPVKPTK